MTVRNLYMASLLLSPRGSSSSNSSCRDIQLHRRWVVGSFKHTMGHHRGHLIPVLGVVSEESGVANNA